MTWYPGICFFLIMALSTRWLNFQILLKHKTSSPWFPQSNGEAEQAVKTVKQLLSKFSDPYLALLAKKASPLNNGYSPSELLMGRRLRTTVPVLPEVLEPKFPDKEFVNEWEEKQKRLQKKGAIPLKQLKKGDKVWISDYKSYGAVIQQTGQPWSYIVQSTDAWSDSRYYTQVTRPTCTREC